MISFRKTQSFNPLGLHFSPSALVKMSRSLVIQPRPCLSKNTELSDPPAARRSPVQVAPPSLVRRSWPDIPTVHALLGSRMNTELSDHRAAGALTRSHLAPPSTVRRMAPPQPTARPCCGSANEMDST